MNVVSAAKSAPGDRDEHDRSITAPYGAMPRPPQNGSRSTADHVQRGVGDAAAPA